MAKLSEEEILEQLEKIKKQQDRCAPNVTIRNNACRNIEAIERFIRFI